MKRILPPVLALAAILALPAVSIGATVGITTPSLPDGVVGVMFPRSVLARR